MKRRRREGAQKWRGFRVRKVHGHQSERYNVLEGENSSEDIRKGGKKPA